MSDHHRRSGNIILHTIQPYDIVDQVFKTGYTVVDLDKSFPEVEPDDSFLPSYRWMINEMITRGIYPSRDRARELLPFWAYCNKEVADFHFFSYLRDEDDQRQYQLNKLVRLTLSVDPQRILVSDHDLWHCVLNNWNNIDWQQIFDPIWYHPDYRHKKHQVYQACFWEIFEQDIIEIIY